jgi:hypothetical protein
MTDIKIGTTYGGMTALPSLATPVHSPQTCIYTPYSATVRTGDNGARGIGLPMVTMYWRALPIAQRDQLRTFCTGLTATVFIYIPTDASGYTFAAFSGTMIWPMGDNYFGPNTQDLTLVIRNLVSAP